MSITNLTNTRWYLNSELDHCGLGVPDLEDFILPGLDNEFNLTFYSNKTQYTSLYYSLKGGSHGSSVRYTNSAEDLYDEVWSGQWQIDEETQEGSWGYLWWSSNAYRYITITGGDDVTNPDCITWLTANAQQMEFIDPNAPVDTEGHWLLFSSPNEFTFESKCDNHSDWPNPSIISNSGYWNGIIEYSTNATQWNVWDGATVISSADGKLYLRGIGNTYITTREALNCSFYFQINGEQVSCTGNIETLLDYETVARGEHPNADMDCFSNMFYGCTALITPPDILMDEIPGVACAEMFWGCSNMTKAPRITATKLMYGDNMQNMFYGCTNLNQLPELLPLEIDAWDYTNMFYGCSNIKLSTEKTDEYKYEYRIPSKGTGILLDEECSITDMFTNTGGTFTGTPEINTTYYTSNEIVRAFPPVEEEPTDSTCTFDLSTLGLPTGTYNIYVILSAEGYKDSEPSNEVVYEKLGYLVPEGCILEYEDANGEWPWIYAGEPFLQPIPETARVMYASGEGNDDVGYAYSADTNSWSCSASAHPFHATDVTVFDSLGGAPVTALEDRAFCSEGWGIDMTLERLYLPASITYIGEGIFDRNRTITEIIYAGTTAEWNNITFHENWNAGGPAFIVTCTDGTIDVPAGEASSGSE